MNIYICQFAFLSTRWLSLASFAVIVDFDAAVYRTTEL